MGRAETSYSTPLFSALALMFDMYAWWKYELLNKNFRHIRVEKEKPGSDDQTLLLLHTGFFFEPALARSFLERWVDRPGYLEGVAPSPVIKVDNELLPPESLADHVLLAQQFFELYYAERQGPIKIIGHSYAHQVLRRRLIDLQHDPRVREAIIGAPYLRKPEGILTVDDMLEAGSRGHREELGWAVRDRRFKEYLRSEVAFCQYERHARRFEEAYRACVNEMLTFRHDDGLDQITEIPVHTFLPKNDFLGYSRTDEEWLRHVFAHPKSTVTWVDGGHNTLFLRPSTCVRGSKKVNRPVELLDAA